ncbi:elicitor-responsive protein 3-like isoform X2 [Silene latifolia]|uniref:elicitor-responsive protein 3-like isoform X2 n=1 Tax=Silene latifolia TaxID=37657 RepID=UPI003D773BC3
MPLGRLEVFLVNAKGLDNCDFLYGGTTPEWNETFVFRISGDVPELHLKIMDKDTFTADDFVGEAKIPLAAVFEKGSLQPTSYNVVKDEEFKGEIKVGLTFTPERLY